MINFAQFALAIFQSGHKTGTLFGFSITETLLGSYVTETLLGLYVE